MSETGWFHGREDMKVDSKYRLSIPADIRRVLEAQDPEWAPSKPARMVLIFGPRLQGFVEGYSINNIAEIKRALEKQPKANPRVKGLRSHFIHNSVTLTIDDTGRIVVPQPVRTKLGLEKDEYITFLGDLKTFQVWRREDFVAVHGAEEDELGDDFDPDAAMDDILYGGDASDQEV